MSKFSPAFSLPSLSLLNLSPHAIFWIAAIQFCIPTTACGNDRIKQAIIRFEKRMEEERAKVMVAFEKEMKVADRKQSDREQKWLREARTAWMNRELMITERGGVRFYSGATETFEANDFKLDGDFLRTKHILKADNGTASISLSKPARSIYFRGIIESKNNFHVLLNHAGPDRTKDVCIVFGGWNNSRSEIQYNEETLARMPVGMPRRWLCEVYCEAGVIKVFANEKAVMTAKIHPDFVINSMSVLVDYDSQTQVVSPILQVK